MERLTDYEVVGGHVHAVPTVDVDQAMMRLAAYEDAGLTPGEVHSLWGEWNAMMSVLNSIGSYDRLRELAEADKAGRAVILPCKVGDAVWILQRRLDGSCCVRATEFWWSDIPQVGKTVFLSSYEAEKALEEEKDDSEDQ